MRAACALSLVLSLAGGVAAAQDGSPFAGPGAFTCGKFANAYKQNPDLIEALYFSWAQGFMSAINLETSVNGPKASLGFRDLSNTSDIKARLREYCNRKPLSGYMEAVMEVMSSLPIGRSPQN